MGLHLHINGAHETFSGRQQDALDRTLSRLTRSAPPIWSHQSGLRLKKQGMIQFLATVFFTPEIFSSKLKHTSLKATLNKDIIQTFFKGPIIQGVLFFILIACRSHCWGPISLQSLCWYIALGRKERNMLCSLWDNRLSGLRAKLPLGWIYLALVGSP